MTGALEDLRVIEMGQLLAGPFAGQLFADFGADMNEEEAAIFQSTPMFRTPA